MSERSDMLDGFAKSFRQADLFGLLRPSSASSRNLVNVDTVPGFRPWFPLSLVSLSLVSLSLVSLVSLGFPGFLSAFFGLLKKPGKRGYCPWFPCPWFPWFPLVSLVSSRPSSASSRNLVNVDTVPGFLLVSSWTENSTLVPQS